jgi:hypothetical protein
VTAAQRADAMTADPRRNLPDHRLDLAGFGVGDVNGHGPSSCASSGPRPDAAPFMPPSATGSGAAFRRLNTLAYFETWPRSNVTTTIHDDYSRLTLSTRSVTILA